MSEQKKKRSQKPQRQQWKPNALLTVLYRIWMVVFTLVKVALGAAATVFIICGVCVIIFVSSLSNYLEEGILPDARIELETQVRDQNSFVYFLDSAGNVKLQQKIFADIYTSWANYEDIPEDLIHAAIAIEDKRFYEHQGVDWITTIKACAGMFFGDADAGGSTITQQLVKNHTGDNDVTVQRKVLEIFRATDLEKRYDKDTIMEYYLNEIFFGRKCKGVRSAAARYFGKELEMLTTAECASLISITNNPSLYDPYGATFAFGEDRVQMSGYERNAYRKGLVLEQMLIQGWLTQEEYDAAAAEVIVNKDGVDLPDQFATCKNEECGYRGQVKTYKHEDGGAYFCPVCNTNAGISESSSQEVYSWMTDTVLEDVAYDLAKRDGVAWNNDSKKYYKEYISRAGLHIYSTLDMNVQNIVDSIYTDLSKIPNTRSGQQLQSAIVVIDNRTGDIVAMAGGVGEKIIHDAFNRATDSKLQSGSSIKPLSIYAPAFNIEGYSPATVIKDLPLKYTGSVGWPKNDNRKYNYARTIHSAIVQSVNAVAANTLDQIGRGYAYDFAKNKFGLSTLTREFIASNGQIKTDEDYAPLAMGAQTVGITVRDMAAGFATFANNGVYREARTYTKVFDSNGNLVLDNTQKSEAILSEKAVNYMNYCLEDAVSGGTGTAARVSGQTVYGKTGTTSSNKDRWFCGFTSHYTAAVWCGYDTPEQIYLVGNSSNPAARLFKSVMTPLHQGLKNKALVNYSKMTKISVCLDCGKLADENCEKDIRGSNVRIESVLVYREDRPKDKCDCHVIVDYCTTGNGVATEWCTLFAGDQQAVLEDRALVRITVERLEEIKKASKCGLVDEYVRDDYIYLVDKKGEDAVFKGIKNNINKNVEAPYAVCTLHTKESWEAYQDSKVPEDLPMDPDDPGNPGAPTNPGEPTDPVVPTDPTEPPKPEGSDPIVG